MRPERGYTHADTHKLHYYDGNACVCICIRMMCATAFARLTPGNWIHTLEIYIYTTIDKVYAQNKQIDTNILHTHTGGIEWVHGVLSIAVAYLRDVMIANTHPVGVAWLSSRLRQQYNAKWRKKQTKKRTHTHHTPINKKSMQVMGKM